MRKNLNKKGFTLVELLAVIVILAVIMVIATQQVNKAIKKSRGNSFFETVQSVRKAAQTVCAMDNKITIKDDSATPNLQESTLIENVDYSTDDIKIMVATDKTITVSVVAGGKFDNNIMPTVKLPFTAYADGVNKESVGSITFIAECPVVVQLIEG